MPPASLLSGQWDSIINRLGQVADLEATAREFKAFERTGKVANAVGLLRLALMYGPGQLSLRGTAAAAFGVVADISDKAVEGRLRKCGDWLQELLERLLRDQGRRGGAGAMAVSLVDGSVISAPGNTARWRLHARYDPATSRFGDLSLTPLAVGEAANRTHVDRARVLIADRGYARVRDFSAVLDAGSDFITRLGWRSVKLQTSKGKPFDIPAHWPKGKQPKEYQVRVRGVDRILRLVIQRLPTDKAARNEKRAIRKSASSGHQIDQRTRVAAGYLMVLTSLPEAEQPAARVLDLYRARWQIELSFKRLKTLGGIDKLPSADPRLARTWLLAHLIVAVLTDELANQIVGFPPCKTRGRHRTHVDLAGLGEGPPDDTLRDHARAA
jgi:hypothetical protein